MPRLPRFALGSIQRDADTRPVAWALMELLTRRGCQVQHFVGRSCLVPLEGAIASTGLGTRHLDSWLTSPEVCRELLVHGLGDSELALVEGEYDICFPDGPRGGSLDTLCRWLDLPRVAVVDVATLDACRLPRRPAVDALLLDRIESPAEASRWQTTLETLWGVPVLGWLGSLGELRAELDAAAIDGGPSREACRALGEALEKNCQLGAILRLAERSEFPEVSSAMFPPQAAPLPLTVAVAYDEAFHCYFPDAFDLLELAGVSLVDFSPLHDEALPAGVDLVYLGCGDPQLWAEELAENQCLMQALRNHVCGGRRIYADGGGLAYLCQSLETPEGQVLPMVGALPARARANPARQPLQPLELSLGRHTWLAEEGASLRGYLSSTWLLEPTGPLAGCFAQPEHAFDLVAAKGVLGSRMQINFAMQPGFLPRFISPLVEPPRAVRIGLC